MTLLLRAELEKWIESYKQIKPAEPYDHPPCDALFTTTDWLRADHLLDEIRKGTFTARAGDGCFWPSGCSDSRRCRDFGSCVAAHQNKHKHEISRPVTPSTGLAGDWLPMETAPRDGTKVKLLCENGEEDTGYWCSYKKTEYPYMTGEWSTDLGNGEPIKWKPLPKPPSRPTEVAE